MKVTSLLLLMSLAQVAHALPKVELRPGKAEGVKVGDVIDVELLGADLPEGAKLRPVHRFQEGYSISESGKIGVLKTGTIQLPALEVVDAAGTVVAETDPIVFNVGSVLSDSGGAPGEADQAPQPEPPAGPARLSLPLGLQATAGLLLAGLLGVGLYFLVRWIRRRFLRARAKPEVSLSADTIALRRLAQLEMEKWYEKGNSKRHFFEISEALKSYLSDRYSIDARESTTTELFDRLMELQEKRLLDAERFRQIRQCFAVLDLVKFTDYQPEPSESIAQLEEARRIVVGTKATPSVMEGRS